VAARVARLPRGAGSGVISRIHVDDLAAIVDAGLFSTLEGAWPVADEWPCSSQEIIRWCNPNLCNPDVFDAGSANLDSDAAALHSANPGRRVDGSRLRRILEVTLTYPSWKTGVPASLAEEQAARDSFY
jgi:hypothetical protein